MPRPLRNGMIALLCMGTLPLVGTAKEERDPLKRGPRELLRNQIVNTRSLLESMLARADLDKTVIAPLYHRTAQWRSRPNPKFVAKVEADLWSIAGPGVVKVEIGTDSARLISPDPLQLVLVRGRPRPWFILLKNAADCHAHIAVSAPEGAGLRIAQNRHIVWAGRTMGFAYEMTADETASRDVVLDLAITMRPENKPPKNMTVPIIVQPDIQGTGVLKVKIVDQATGRPIHARIYLRASDGSAPSPKGSLARATMTGDEFFYGAESFELSVPAGKTTIEAVRGAEYRPLRTEVEVKPGETTETTLKLERFIDMASLGWFSGDMHSHANYTKDEFIKPEDVLTQALGEDLNILNMNVANSTGAWIHDRKYFDGKPHPLSRPKHIICWNEEFRNYRLYGHMCMIGLEKLVEPIYTGFLDTPNWADFPPNYDLAKEAQDQQGAVSYPHPLYLPGQFGFRWASAREFPADLALGVIDAIDVLSNADDQMSMKLWYGVLNCGLRCGISAGSDAFMNIRRHYLPGADRVYVHVGPKFGYEEWIQAFKKSKSFATNGPMLFFTVNECGAGTELKVGTREKPVLKAKLKVISLLPLDALEIVVNGEVVASKKPEPGQETIELAADVPLKTSSWIAGRCTGPKHRLNTMDDFVLAHSSPIYCLIGDQKIGTKEDLSFYVDWLNKLWENTDENGQFAKPSDKVHVFRVFMRAKKIYEDMLKNAAPEVLDY